MSETGTDREGHEAAGAAPTAEAAAASPPDSAPSGRASPGEAATATAAASAGSGAGDAPAGEPSGALETAPCYCCGGTRGVPTGGWWILPLLMSHVRCLDCGRTYDARSGESNAPAFLSYLAWLAAGIIFGVLVARFVPAL